MARHGENILAGRNLYEKSILGDRKPASMTEPERNGNRSNGFFKKQEELARGIILA